MLRGCACVPCSPSHAALSGQPLHDVSKAGNVLQPSEAPSKPSPTTFQPRTSAVSSSVKSAPGEDPPSRRTSATNGVTVTLPPTVAPDAEDDGPPFDIDAQKADGEAKKPRLKKGASGVTDFLEARQKLRTSEVQKFIAYVLVCFTVGLDFAGFTLTAPLIPFYVEVFEDGKEMGFGTANSILTASYALSMLVATPLFGTLSDRFGRRSMLLVSLLGSGLGFIGQGLAPSMKAMIGIRFITGCFGGSRPVAVAWIGDTFPPEQQAAKIGMVAAAISLALFMAPVLGGSMGLVSLSLPCFFLAAVTLFTFWLSWLYVMEPEKAKADKPTAASGGAPVEKAKIPVRPLSINALNGALSMGVSAGWQTLFPVVGSAGLGLNQNTIGLMQGLGGLAVGVTQFVIFVPLGKRFKLPYVGAVGMILQAAVVFLGPFVNLWVAVACTCAQAVGACLGIGGSSVTASILAPPAHRGKIMSFTYTAQAASRVVFPMLVGPLYDAASIAPFLMILAVGLLGFVSHMALSTTVGKIGAKPPGRPAAPKREADPGASEEKRRSLGRVLQGLQSAKEELESELTEWRGRLAGLEGGRAPAELGVPVDVDALPEVEDGQQVELGRWMSTLLVARNYRDWPQNLGLVEAALKNAFPRIQTAPERRAEDLVRLLEGHLQLERFWELHALRGMLGGDEMGEMLTAKAEA